jgi:hypothetical protein
MKQANRFPIKRLSFISLLLCLTVAYSFGQSPDWHREFPGFKIAGNLYYVGTADLAVYLVKTPKGNIRYAELGIKVILPGTE